MDGLIGVNAVLTLLEDLLMTPMKQTTLGEVILDLVDIELDVAEDCLHLAVSTPRLPGKDKTKQGDLLPVMFFIYGGGYFAG